MSRSTCHTVMQLKGMHVAAAKPAPIQSVRGCCRLDNQTVHLDAAEPAPMDVTADEQKAEYS